MVDECLPDLPFIFRDTGVIKKHRALLSALLLISLQQPPPRAIIDLPTGPSIPPIPLVAPPSRVTFTAPDHIPHACTYRFPGVCRSPTINENYLTLTCYHGLLPPVSLVGPQSLRARHVLFPPRIRHGNYKCAIPP